MRRGPFLRLGGLAALALSALVAAACGTTINKVLADPSRYRDHEVHLSGNVIESFSMGDRGAYEIADETGRMWVVSDRGVPRKGAKVKVTGTIREGFNLGLLGDRIKLPAGIGSGLVLMESSHKAQY